jgi:hypothetical protein
MTIRVFEKHVAFEKPLGQPTFCFFLFYQNMPECSAPQSGDEWHPYNSPPLMGGDKGLPARASQWQAGIKGEEVVLASFRCPAACRGEIQ